MSRAADVKRIAMNLEGTLEAPHFDRIAYKVKRIYASVAPDKKTINLLLSPDEQEMKVMLAPNIYTQIPNAWGKQGWTSVQLASIHNSELEIVLRLAWEHARTVKRR